jgi:hypothetical protein
MKVALSRPSDGQFEADGREVQSKVTGDLDATVIYCALFFSPFILPSQSW